MFQFQCALAAQVGLFVSSFAVLSLSVAESVRAQSAGSLPAFTCGAAQWSPQSAAAAAFAVTADFAGNRPMRTFTNGLPFTIEMHAAAPTAEVLEWQVTDYNGRVAASGNSQIKGTGALSVSCVSTRAGYFSLGAHFQGTLHGLPRIGSRPAGIATFGVLPNVAPWLPAVPSGPLDAHRFGLQGANFARSGVCCEGNGLQPVNYDVGSTWVLDSRSELNMEPKYAGQYNPTTHPLDVGFEDGRLARIVTLNGIPAWASTAPAAGARGSYPPKSFADFRVYTSLVGEESARVQATYIPNQDHNYYQITWEPDPGTPTEWKGSDAEFVHLYEAAWGGVHTTDPNAQVMGPTTTSIPLCDAWLNRLAPLGLTRYLDA